MYTEKDNRTVSILGTEYKILFLPEDALAELEADGIMDHSIKTIKVGVFVPNERNISDLTSYQKKVLRHEIIHAFFYESGLWNNSGASSMWALNEEMVDWLAIQHEKLHTAFETAGAL